MGGKSRIGARMSCSCLSPARRRRGKFAQYRPIPSKINAFCHASPGFQPWRRIDTETFGLQPTYQSVRRPRMGCADFLSRVVAEISRNISGKKVVVARKAFPERRRCTRGNSGKGQAVGYLTLSVTRPPPNAPRLTRGMRVDRPSAGERAGGSRARTRAGTALVGEVSKCW